MPKYAEGEFDDVIQIYPFVVTKTAPYQFGLMTDHAVLENAVMSALRKSANETSNENGADEWHTLISFDPFAEDSQDEDGDESISQIESDCLVEIELIVYRQDTAPGYYYGSRDAEYAGEGFRYVSIIAHSERIPFRREELVDLEDYPEGFFNSIQARLSSLVDASLVGWAKTWSNSDEFDEDQGDLKEKEDA